MIKTNWRKMLKAVDILRERKKMENDVENSAWEMNEDVDRILRQNYMFQGEYAKSKARQKKMRRTAWIVFWVVIIILIGII